MTKTLADMTAEERAKCVGMWCESEDYGTLLVIAHIEDDAAQAAVPQGLYPYEAPLKYFTPRFDLPRAWTPEGEPVEMDIETDRVEYGRVEGGGVERVSFPDGTKVRRLVGEWEETND